MRRRSGAARRLGLRVTWFAMRIAGRVSTRLGGRLAARLWFTPWPPSLATPLERGHARWLADTDEVRITVEGVELVGFAVGQGPVVLLVHGWSHHAGHLRVFADALAEGGFRAIGIDLPSHGRSAKGTTDGYVFARMIAALARAFEARVVVGHSLGALATLVALRDGLQLDGVVLVAPALDVEHMVTWFARTLSIPPRAEAGMRARFGEQYPGLWEDLRPDRLAPGNGQTTLVILDPDDSRVELSDAEALARNRPNVELRTVSGLGHVRILGSTEVADAIAAFLQETAAAQDAPPQDGDGSRN